MNVDQLETLSAVCDCGQDIETTARSHCPRCGCQVRHAA